MNSVNIFDILYGVEESPDTKPCTQLEETEDTRPHVSFNLVHSFLEDCRSIKEFINFEAISEGAYGLVHKATDSKSGEIVAVKQLFGKHDGLSLDAQRELDILLKMQHPNIVAGREIVVGSSFKQVYIVMDFIKFDLRVYIEMMRRKSQFFAPGHAKCLLQQLLRAVHHLHKNWILHRDLKPSNILLTQDGVLKVADFGMAREYHDPLWPYTPGVVTLWYRAPELLLLADEYATPIDMWSVGCIFAEVVNLEPLFNATSEMELLKKIFTDLGTPTDEIWPGYSALPLAEDVIFEDYPPGGLRQRIKNHLSETGLSLLHGLLTYDPARRVSAAAALQDRYFEEEPLATEPVAIETSEAEDDEESTGSDSDDLEF